MALFTFAHLANGRNVSETNRNNKVEDIDKNYPNKQQEEFFGEWVIENKLAYGRVSIYGEDNIGKLLNKKISYSKELACFDNHFLKNPKYKKTVLKKDEFFEMYSMPFETLGIESDSVVEVVVYTDDNFNDLWFSTEESSTGSTFLVKNKNTLILIDGGAYFTLKRVNTSAPKVSQAGTIKIRELIANYEKSLVEAINTGDFFIVEPYLAQGSNLYKSQQKLVSNLYGKQTKEKLVTFNIQAIDLVGKDTYKVSVVEKIGIRTVKQKVYTTKEFRWTYTVIVRNGHYFLSDIEK